MYSRWDGTQVGLDLDADALMAEMSDELLYHGDVNSALRRVMQQGIRDVDGQQLAGLREMLERLRERRRAELERRDLGGVYDDVATQLREIIQQERAGVERQLRDAQDGDDIGHRRSFEEVARRHLQQLDEISPDLAGMVNDLRDYDFLDGEARQRFDDLMEELRSDLMRSYFNRMSAGMSDVSPEQMNRVKDMLAELNQMLGQRERGEPSDFQGFMERYGDFFPGNPRSLDELLGQMARSMAQMQALMNSMSPEQRAELQQLADMLLEDMDLRWQMDELARNLQSAFPQLGWDQQMQFSGQDPMQFAEMPGLLETLGDLDELENLLSSATQPSQLAEVDLDRASELLGEDAAHALERLAAMAKTLEEAGLIEQREGRFEMTPQAIRAIGRKALGDLYRKLEMDRAGTHVIPRDGLGHERSYAHKPYEFGDPFNLDVEQTIRNAIRRSGMGTPVQLLPEDFEVERTETATRSSTVLLLDVSMSMPMRDNFLPAKKVAIALQSLITSQFPRDYFGLVSFGRVAREVKPELLPELSWDFEWGTNMAHAMMLARKLLAHRPGTKQIIMVTDGEPTAHITADGYPFFSYPSTPETITETLREVMRCTREGIRINTFVLDESPYLRSFVDRMMRINRGRSFYTTNDNLGEYVLVDFLEHRRMGRAG